MLVSPEMHQFSRKTRQLYDNSTGMYVAIQCTQSLNNSLPSRSVLKESKSRSAGCKSSPPQEEMNKAGAVSLPGSHGWGQLHSEGHN